MARAQGYGRFITNTLPVRSIRNIAGRKIKINVPQEHLGLSHASLQESATLDTQSGSQLMIAAQSGFPSSCLKF